MSVFYCPHYILQNGGVTPIGCSGVWTSGCRCSSFPRQPRACRSKTHIRAGTYVVFWCHYDLSAPYSSYCCKPDKVALYVALVSSAFSAGCWTHVASPVVDKMSDCVGARWPEVAFPELLECWIRSFLSHRSEFTSIIACHMASLSSHWSVRCSNLPMVVGESTVAWDIGVRCCMVVMLWECMADSRSGRDISICL